MKVKLTLDVDDNSYKGKHKQFKLEFCRDIFSKLNVTSDNCVLTALLKNPRKAGFFKVNLQRGHRIWRWRIQGISAVPVFLLPDMDILLDEWSGLTHEYAELVVWAKFETA